MTIILWLCTFSIISLLGRVIMLDHELFPAIKRRLYCFLKRRVFKVQEGCAVPLQLLKIRMRFLPECWSVDALGNPFFCGVTFNQERDTLTIDGQEYSRELLRVLGKDGPPERVFRFTKPNGVLSFEVFHSIFLVGQYRSGEVPNVVWEFQGVFLTREEAISACRNRNYFVLPVTLGKLAPDEPVNATEAGAFYPLRDVSIRAYPADDLARATLPPTAQQ